MHARTRCSIARGIARGIARRHRSHRHRSHRDGGSCGGDVGALVRTCAVAVAAGDDDGDEDDDAKHETDNGTLAQTSVAGAWMMMESTSKEGEQHEGIHRTMETEVQHFMQDWMSSECVLLGLLELTHT
jgi:hypothetical protein